jgi:hypothetical protein
LIGLVVQIGHGPVLGPELVKLLLRAKGLLDQRPGDHIAQFSADERSAFSRLDVLKLGDAVDIALVPDRHADFELIG